MPIRDTDKLREQADCIRGFATNTMELAQKLDATRTQLGQATTLLRMLDDYLNRAEMDYEPWNQAQINNLKEKVKEFLYKGDGNAHLDQ